MKRIVTAANATKGRLTATRRPGTPAPERAGSEVLDGFVSLCDFEPVAQRRMSHIGARNLDTLPATIDVLPHVVEKVAGRVPVLVDGGIRRGTDVVKALARGANAVLIGRPYLHGLAVAGDKGVERVVEILRNELEMAMGLLGRPTIQSVDRSALWS